MVSPFDKSAVSFRQIETFFAKNFALCQLICIFAHCMKEMQFSAIVMMVMMCSALIVQMPGRVKHDTVCNRSRWLMVGALSLIGAQFVVQYLTQLRAMGITQAVLVNLAFFVPASSLMNLTILNLQRQGRLSRFERCIWIGVTLVVIASLAIAVMTDGHPLSQLSERVLNTEICMSVLYAAMQIYYCVLQLREMLRMQAVIEDYYDREHQGLTRWMKLAIGVNGLLAVFVPLLIFGPNLLIAIFSLAFFWGIFMMWFSFTRYFSSSAMKRVREAEENANTATTVTPAPDVMKHISSAVDHWLATGAHLKAGITSPVAAEAMNIPRYQLTAWVKAMGHKSFTRWITTLRIEEAKSVFQQHPDWTNEAIADHCGFNRTHFQKIFKQETGVAPSEYIKRMPATYRLLITSCGIL